MSKKDAMVNNDYQNKEVGHYEDLRTCAGRIVSTIHLQVKRLQNILDEFPLSYVSDTEFLILNLNRLYGIACQINEMANSNNAIGLAINEFDEAFPNLQEARNVISHIDEYLCGKGREKTVNIGSLSTHVSYSDRIRFAEYEFDLERSFKATVGLYNAIRKNPPVSYLQAVAAYQRQKQR